MAIPENVRLTGKSLAHALETGDLKAARKWAQRLAALLDHPPVAPAPPAVVAAAVETIVVTTHVSAAETRPLTYDEEDVLYLAAGDEILKAQGKHYGHEGAERDALPLSTHMDLCRRLNLPLHLAELESFVVPGASQ
jgi:hypothetical protein